MPIGEFLFVYGTLMSTAADPMGDVARRRLRDQSSRIAAAFTSGRLVDLGSYPGLVAGASAASLVHGEVLRLHDPQRAFTWLDAYESIDPRPGAVNEYRRELRRVTLDTGADTDAWLYTYVLEFDRFPLIASGRWSDRAVF